MAKNTTKKASKATTTKSTKGRKLSLRSLRSSETPVNERVQGLASLTNSVLKDEKSFDTAIQLLTDTTQPSPVRLAALQSLQAASFSVLTFQAHQPEYIAALRKVMDDADPELRQRVLGILSADKDRVAQKR